MLSYFSVGCSKITKIIKDKSTKFHRTPNLEKNCRYFFVTRDEMSFFILLSIKRETPSAYFMSTSCNHSKEREFLHGSYSMSIRFFWNSCNELFSIPLLVLKLFETLILL